MGSLLASAHRSAAQREVSGVRNTVQYTYTTGTGICTLLASARLEKPNTSFSTPTTETSLPRQYRYIIAEQPHTRQQGNPPFSSFYRILKTWSLLLSEPSRSPLRSTLTHVQTETPSMSEFHGTRTGYELVSISIMQRTYNNNDNYSVEDL